MRSVDECGEHEAQHVRRAVYARAFFGSCSLSESTTIPYYTHYTARSLRTDMERLQSAMDAVDGPEHQGVAVMVYNFVSHDVARKIGHEQHAAEEQSKVRRRF